MLQILICVRSFLSEVLFTFICAAASKGSITRNHELTSLCLQNFDSLWSFSAPPRVIL